MLWRKYEDEVQKITRVSTYDASIQRHGSICEFIENLNSKLIILVERCKYADLDIIVILTLLA